MVSIEELLKRVQQAETEIERQWILLELQMSQMSDDLVSMLWAAAIPHFFDANILAALRPELAEQAERLYEDLKSLTFVEEFPNQGYNLHELTRNVLLHQLWQNDREQFFMLSQRAADYFFEEKTLSEKDVEFCYHEILNEGESQTGRLLDRAVDWWTYYQVDRMQSALQGFTEQEKAGRLPCFGKGFSRHLQGVVESCYGRYPEAELFFMDAESFYDKVELKNFRYITALLRDQGNSKKDQGDYDDSFPYHEKALNISEEQLGKNNPDTATSLNNLATLYQDQGKYKEAEFLFRRSLKICEEQLGENNPDTATSLNNLASIYQTQRKYKEAEPLFHRSLKICEEQLGENNPDTATSLNNLASIYQTQRKYKEAEPLFHRSLKICEEQLGENNPDTAIALNNLASLYRHQGKYKEAENFFCRSLKICEEQLGKNHPKTANLLNNLALLYQDQGKYQDAEPLLLRSLKIREEQLGENHPDTSTVLNNLAELYQKQKRYSDSIPLLERWKNVKRERQETRNTEYADRICTLGRLYEKCQKFSEAVSNYEEALCVFKLVLDSKKHPRIRVLQAELNRLKKTMKKQKKS